ncbi:MAG TPA: DUF4398 domain-containing protein [Polyangiales bacterium]
MRTLLGVLAVIGVGIAGCAGHPAPTEQVASSLAAVRGAEEVGARDVPEAALHVKLAEEQIERAKKLMGEGENARAEDVAVRAYQDAELALAIARESNSKRKLESFASAHETAGGEQPMTPAMTPAQ